MAQIENRGPGARKIKLERRLDENARLVRKALSKPEPRKPATHNKSGDRLH